MTCPNCNQTMTSQVLAGHLGASVTIDLCFGCQVFWFDARESLQLAPASTLRLFRLIGEAAATERRALSTTARCPRCGLTLKLVHDFQRTTRFQYRRCPRGHGRLTTFFDFLREKNFLRPMSPAQIEELRRHIGMVNCSNCGGAIDLNHASACSHCGSALSILDTTQAEKLIAELRAADRSGEPVDPALPMKLQQAKREVTQAFDHLEDGPGWYRAVSASGLVVAGLQSLARWLGRDI